MMLRYVIWIVLSIAALAQEAPEWEAKAGGKLTFEVASIKPAKGDVGPPGFPINVSEAYRETGGRFKADFSLLTYIEFAYKLPPIASLEREMLARLPKWIATDAYSIEARASGHPTKDQMRLMMQALLAERFRLAVHFENKEVPVEILTLVKAGKPGPNLRPHDEGPACDAGDPLYTPAPAAVIRGDDSAGSVTFPTFCDSFALIRRPNGTLLMGYRNATMEMIANSLSGAVGQGRPVIDRTGLSGRFDFTLAWMPDANLPAPSASPGAPDPAATSLQALRDQLGLKVEASKAPLRTLVIDRVERPTEN
jgi:bla regulator protein BlaR1